MKQFLRFFTILSLIIACTTNAELRIKSITKENPSLSQNEKECLLKILPDLQYACEVFDSSSHLLSLKVLCHKLIHNNCNIPTTLVREALGNLALVLHENNATIFNDQNIIIVKKLFNSLLLPTAKNSLNKLPTRAPRPSTSSKPILSAVSQEIISGGSFAEDITGFNGGGVKGPAFSSDNAIARYHGSSDDTILNSGVIIDDSNNITGVTTLECQEAVVPSDFNLKESIKNIISLNPATFAYKTTPDKSDRGFIAQEVLQILPSQVVKTKDGHLTVNYKKLVVELIAAVQQLQKI